MVWWNQAESKDVPAVVQLPFKWFLHWHGLFKDFIRERRPSLDVDSVATGEHWFGTQALALGLVDEIKTSDDLIVQACQNKKVLAISYVQKKTLTDKLAGVAGEAAENVFMKLLSRGQRPIV